jgi:hypothetical protein
MSLSSLYPTISPSLLLDFANSGVLDPRVTFTRPTGGTYFGPDGVLRTAQANAPRFDYNPATLAAQGLLIEEQRKNLLTYSQDLSSWSLGTGTVTANTTTSPNGTVDADTYNINTDATTPNINCSISDSVTYSVSIFVNLTQTADVIRVRASTAAGSLSAFFTVSTKIWSNLNAGFSGGTYTQISTNWIRISIEYTPAVGDGGTRSFGFAGVTTAGGSVADTGNTLILWGAQLEAGAFPTSYIPTTTASLTRAADVASVNTLSPWFNASEGTLYVETTRGYTGNFVNFPHTGGLSDGTNSNVIWAGYGIAGNQGITPDIASGGVDQLDFVSAAYTMPTAKAAIAYKTNDSQWFFRGTAFAADTTCTMPSGINRLNIGSENTTTQPWNGWIRRVMYYPRRLSQAEGIAITA